MANGRVFPSATQGGLSRGAAIILETMLRRRELSQRDRQLSQQDRALDLEEQAQGMERLINFAPFLPGDVPIADLPFLHEDIRTVFGEGVDPANPEDIGAISLNQKDLMAAVEDRLKGMAEELPDDSPFFERGLARAFTGEPVSEEELGAREAQAITQRNVAEMTLESFNSLMRDSQAQQGIQRMLTGLEVPVRIVTPDGVEHAFDTEAAARISAQLWMHRDELTLQWQRMSAEEANDLAGEFMQQLEKIDLTIGRPQANRIIQAWNQSVTGDFEPGESPFEQMAAKAEADGDFETLTAIHAWDGVVDSGDQSTRTFMELTDQGDAMSRTFGVLKRAEQFMEREDLMKLAPSILEGFQGAGIAQIEDPVFGGPRFVIPDLPTGEAGVGGASLPSGAGETEGGNLETQRQMFLAAQQMQADAEALAAGMLSIAQIREKYQDPETVSRIVRVSQRIRRGGGG